MARVSGEIHFSRGQKRESRSSVFLCSETAQKRLLRRLTTTQYQFYNQSIGVMLMSEVKRKTLKCNLFQVLLKIFRRRRQRCNHERQ